MSDSWRQELEKRCASLPEAMRPAATGLRVSFSDFTALSLGREVLDAATPVQRQALWAAFFPAVQAEVEIAWNELSMQVVARRDGGDGGHGERFTWPPTQLEAMEHRFTWLRKLLIIAGPNDSLGLPELLVKVVEYDRCSYENISGEMYDVDAVAYLAVPILNRGGPLADECMDVLSRSLDGTHPQGRFGRHVMTALLCSDRPDAWALVDGNLADAGIDEGFRQKLLVHRHGIHPGAWRHFLRTLVDHRLWRFACVKDYLPYWLGIEWRWDTKPGTEGWLQVWTQLHEDVALCAEKLRGGSPAELFLALYALAIEDGMAAIREAERIVCEPNAVRRLACAFFLSLCSPEPRAASLVRLADDADMRVVSVATRALATYGPRVPLPTDFSQRMETLLKQGVKQIEASPEPLPEIKSCQDAITELMAEALTDGDEKLIMPWLSNFSIRAQDHLIWKWKSNTQTPAQRLILLKLMHGANLEMVKKAVEAAQSGFLSSSEIAELESMLALKHAQRRLLLIDLLIRQPEQTILSSAQRLIETNKLEQRLAGLELLRRLSSNEALRSQLTSLVAQAQARDGLSQDERNQIQELNALLGPTKEETPPSSANAFGLVDPATLPTYPPPQDRGVMLYSLNTVYLLKKMDELLKSQSDVEFTAADSWDGQPKQTSIAHGGVPYFHRDRTPEENRKFFPLLQVWEEWWQNRPPERRDADGFELERMAVMIETPCGTQPKYCRVLYGLECLPQFGRRQQDMSKLVGWLLMYLREPGHENYVLDALETAMCRAKECDALSGAQIWFQRAGMICLGRIQSGNPDKEQLRQYWRLGTQLCHPDAFRTNAWSLCQLFRLGIIRKDEFIWQVVGSFGPWHGEHLTMLHSSYHLHHFPEIRDPNIQQIARLCLEHVISFELRRGEASTEASYVLARIQRVSGLKWFFPFLNVLGSAEIRRNRATNDPTRASVFTHLICVCHPEKDDTAESFAAAWKQSGVSRERLIEVSVLAPQWAAFIGHALGVSGLKDAVDWIHAHTKTSEWTWQTKTREMWAGELSRLTPVSAEELLEGAVDAAWFQRAHAAVGPKLWSQLYDAAKFACSGSGHSRARLFADALLGEVTATELADMIKTKGHQDAVRSIGLVPLPSDAKKRKAELLKRYRILAAFRHGSAKSKAQKRASEETACRIGLSNLARAAGYADPERFAWVMETEEAKDLTSKAQQAVIGDVNVKLEVTPFGKVELVATKAGKPLKSLPSALKKHAALAALIQRREEARDQVARMRPALEDMMVRGVSLDAGEWRDLMRHPFVAPLLHLLVLTSPEGSVGFPMRDGSGLLNAEGKTVAWPPDKTPLRLAHPGDLLPAKTWHAWQSACFDRRIVQPFKQVFRELYVVVDKEKGPHGESRRYEGHALQPHQALAILGKRGWVHHPEDGLHRVYHAADCVAWLSFEEYFHHPGELQQATVSAMRFTNKAGKALPIENVEPRIFSEAMRDVDLIVSVAHITDTDPEASRSSVEMREALIRETCRLLKLDNVRLEPPSILVQGTRGAYRVHLSSGVVHLNPGRMLYLQPVADRDRLFLPFADDDPKSVEILSKVLLLAEDGVIKDPGLLAQLSA